MMFYEEIHNNCNDRYKSYGLFGQTTNILFVLILINWLPFNKLVTMLDNVLDDPLACRQVVPLPKE